MTDRRPLAALALVCSLVAGAPAGGAEPAGAAPLPGLSTATLACGGLERTWHCYVSTRFAADRTRPLLVVLHGGGGKGSGMRALTRQAFEHLADRDDGVIAYPDAVAGNWNDGRRGAIDRAHTEQVDDVGFIAALIADATSRYAIDPRRVYVTGMSNGAIMSYRLARELSSTLAAIAPVCGYPGEGETATPWAAPMAALLIAGDADPLVPFSGGAVTVAGLSRGRVESEAATVRFLVAQAHADPTAVPLDLPDADPDDGTRIHRDRYPALPGGCEVQVYVVAGGGHGWPGGLPYLPPALIGRTSRDLDACAVIWAFCLAHPRP